MTRAVGRALAALGLWLGFYLTGFGLAFALAWIPWAQIRYERTLGWGGGFAAVGACWTLWAVFPRFRRARLAGSPLDPALGPGLVALVREVAADMGQRAPAAIHVFAEANAFALRRPRWLGFGGEPIVGVGLPLVALLDTAELRAVVAHELGHHHAGDVRLGPWLYRTRRAIGETLARLDGGSFWLHLPFVLYARLFMRVTQRVVQRQELHADALAARVCGVAATARALVRTHEDAPLWGAYFRGEYAPLVERGFCPPLLEGFELFRRAVALRPKVVALVAEARRDADRARPTDTHPTLSERLLALAATGEAVAGGSPALALVADVPAVEERIVRDLLVDRDTPLERVPWSSVTERMWLPYWRETLRPHADIVAEWRAEQLPDVVAGAARYVQRLRRAPAVLSAAAERRRFVALLGCWYAVALADKGYSVDAAPGAEVVARRGALAVEPFAEIHALAEGHTSKAAWLLRVADLGLASST